MILSIRKTRTAALYSQSDRMVEQMKWTIGKYLSNVVTTRKIEGNIFRSSWWLTDQLLTKRPDRHQLEFCSVEKWDAIWYLDVNLAGEDCVTELRRRVDDIHQEIRSHTQIASNRMKERYDIRAEEDAYATGELVGLYNPQRNGVCRLTCRSRGWGRTE